MNLNLQKTKTKERPTKLLLIKKKKILLKENGKKEWIAYKNTFYFLISLKIAMFPRIFQKIIEYGKEVKFCKEDKSIVWSTYPPFEIALIDCKGTEVKASPVKIADVDTPVLKIIEQNNFTNNSLYIIGQQLDRIEEKIVEKSTSSKPEKPLIDLPNIYIYIYI